MSTQNILLLIGLAFVVVMVAIKKAAARNIEVETYWEEQNLMQRTSDQALALRLAGEPIMSQSLRDTSAIWDGYKQISGSVNAFAA